MHDATSGKVEIILPESVTFQSRPTMQYFKEESIMIKFSVLLEFVGSV